MRLKLRRALKVAGRADLLTAIAKGRASQPREVVVKDTELDAMLEVVPPYLALMMLLSREAGLRFETARTLRESDVDLEARRITVRSKGQRNVSVPVSARLYEPLLVFCMAARRGQVLTSVLRRNDEPPKASAIRSALHKARKRLRLDNPPWGLHDLRRTAARRLYAATHDVWKVQQFLCHESLTTTLWYLGNATGTLSPEDIDKASSEKESAV